MQDSKLHPAVGIGHVHLRVADIERATAFYRDVLGFDVMAYGPDFGLPGAAFLSAGGYHHHIGLNTWTSGGGSPPPQGHTGLYHLAIVYPNRLELARAVGRVLDLAQPIDGAEDHGATVSVYLRDPDGNGIELYYDRPREEWFDPEGNPVLKAEPFDPRDLLAEARSEVEASRLQPHSDDHTGVGAPKLEEKSAREPVGVGARESSATTTDERGPGGVDVSLDTADAMSGMIMGFRTTQLIHAAAKLGIADLLEDGPRDASAIASIVGAHPRALYRLLRALASLGIFAETPDGRFELTPLARTIKSDTPGSLRDLAVLYGEEWVWHAYGRTAYSVETGLPAFDLVHDQPFFEYLRLNPEAASSFYRAMTAFSERESAAILASYDFHDATSVVDVGGGRGALLAGILAANPRALGILFDLPAVVAGAREQMARAGVADRCSAVAGDFFEAVPEGSDVYLLKSVIHDWDEARSIAILKNCRDAMAPRSRLLMVERVVPDGDGPSEAKLFDINMLVVAGGLERTGREYREMLHATGFDLTRIIPTRAPVSIVEGVPRAD